MKILLFAGSPNTGKSNSVHAMCKFLIGKGYVKTDIPYAEKKDVYTSVFKEDFACILSLGDVRVLIHTATDDLRSINKLSAHIDTHSPNVVITSCRDYGDHKCPNN